MLLSVFTLAISGPFDIQITPANHLPFDEIHSFLYVEDNAHHQPVIKMPTHYGEEDHRPTNRVISRYNPQPRRKG